MRIVQKMFEIFEFEQDVLRKFLLERTVSRNQFAISRRNISLLP